MNMIMDKYNLDDQFNYTINFKSIDEKHNKLDEYFEKWKNEISEKLEIAFRSRKTHSRAEESQEKELKIVREKNQELRRQIEKKTVEIAQKRIQYENRKKEQKALAQEVKQTYEAYIMAKKHFKKYLNIYLTIESADGNIQIIFVQFFTEHKKEDENYSVRFERNMTDASYSILSTTPELNNLGEFQKKLLETKDVPGALCALREAFIAIKSEKCSH